MTTNYVTDEIRALIGVVSAPVTAADPVDPSEIWRFHHATLDPAPRYFDESWAARAAMADWLRRRPFRSTPFAAPPAIPIRSSAWAIPISMACRGSCAPVCQASTFRSRACSMPATTTNFPLCQTGRTD